MDAANAGGTGDAAAVLAHLHHRDPAQLLFQVGEIVGDQTYLRHGIAVDPGDLVLDVGVAAAFFAVVCGADVHSFEPIPANYADLLVTIADLPTCRAHPYGLSDERRTATLTHYPNSSAMSGLYADPERDEAVVRRCMENLGMTDAAIDTRMDHAFDAETVECELRTLSDAVAELGIDTIDLLKIDVERAETDVLDGIDVETWPKIRQIVAEVHDAEGFTDRCRRHGFEVVVDAEASMRGTGLEMVYATRASD